MSRNGSWSVLCGAFAVALLSHRAPAQTTPTHLRVYLGGMLSGLGASGSVALAISNSGSVAGYATISGRRTAIVWERYRNAWYPQNLGACFYTGTSEARDVSDNGEVVGIYTACTTCPPVGARWRKARMDQPGGWTVTTTERQLQGVNNTGERAEVSVSQGVGTAYQSSWYPERNGRLCAAGPDTSRAVNDPGDVLGERTNAPSRAYVHVKKEPTSASCPALPLTSPANASHGYAINARGHVAGSMNRLATGYEATVWFRNDVASWSPFAIHCSSNNRCPSGYLGRFTASEAIGINDLGQAVGYHAEASGLQKAFFWDQRPETSSGFVNYGELRFLDDLSYRNRPNETITSWSFRVARDVNDAGAIVGTGVFNGVSGAFLVEPATPYSIVEVPFRPKGINDGGRVVGLGLELSDVPDSGLFTWSPSGLPSPPTPDQTKARAQALDINDLNFIAGAYESRSGTTTANVLAPLLFTSYAPIFELFEDPAFQTGSAQVFGLGNSGQSVGSAMFFRDVPVSWETIGTTRSPSGGTYATITETRRGPLWIANGQGCHQGYQVAANFHKVNASGVIAGNCYNSSTPPLPTAMLWRERASIEDTSCVTGCGSTANCYHGCGYLPIAEFASVTDVNGRGQVTVKTDDLGSGLVFHEVDGLTQIPPLGGDTWTTAEAVNSRGEVVGSSIATDPNPCYGECEPGLQRAVVWGHRAAGIPVLTQDLNQLLTPADQAHWLLTQALDLNDAGQITGIGEHDGQLAGFVLTLGRDYLPNGSGAAPSCR